MVGRGCGAGCSVSVLNEVLNASETLIMASPHLRSSTMAASKSAILLIGFTSFTVILFVQICQFVCQASCHISDLHENGDHFRVALAGGLCVLHFPPSLPGPIICALVFFGKKRCHLSESG